jgi:hypothetical protein
MIGVTDVRIERVIHAEGRYVAGAVDGTVLTSSDGVDWGAVVLDAEPDLNLRNWMRGVAYGDGRWILAGDRGSIWHSPDAQTWARLTFGDSTGFQDVHHDDGLWVLVGNAGDVRTSPNGIDWTKRVSGTTARIRTVHHAEGIWVTAGHAGEVLTSTNAASWVLRRRQVSSSANEQLWDVGFGAGRWVAVGQKGAGATALLLTSTNGVAWTEVPAVGSTLQSVHCFDGLWVATGQSGTLLTSPDGVIWTTQAAFTGTSLADSIRIDGRWTLVGSLGLIARGIDPTAVVLSLVAQGTEQLEVSWPSEAVGWVLESAPTVDGEYGQVQVVPTVAAGRKQVLIPRTGSQAFFRLGVD